MDETSEKSQDKDLKTSFTPDLRKPKSLSRFTNGFYDELAPVVITRKLQTWQSREY
jgi:hypothetical protein